MVKRQSVQVTKQGHGVVMNSRSLQLRVCVYFNVLVFVSIFAGSFLVASSAQAKDIYIAQNAVGAANGADCSNAVALSWANSSSNWGTGTNKIGPGTAVHLCGAITATAGATGITIYASGTSGNPIKILFEPGASLSAPYWNSAITLSGQSFVIIDGGSNGVIQNTANGTGLAYQNASNAIYIGGNVSNVEVQNLTIANIYVHSGNGEDGSHNNSAIFASAGTQSNISIHNNTIHDAFAGILSNYGSLKAMDIYANTISYVTWGVGVLDNNSNDTATNVNIYGNDICCFTNWFDTGFANHFDGIILAATNSNTALTNSSIYNNYLHGQMDVNGTAYIYLTGQAGGMNGVMVYNNLVVESTGPPTGSPEADIVLGYGAKNVSIYNNTLASSDSGGGSEGIRIRDSGGSGHIIENNIFYNLWMNIELYANNSIAVSNYNDFSGPASTHAFSCYGTWKSTLADWRSACSLDANSVTGAPKLDADYHLLSGSAALGLGADLTSLGITTLNDDKSGVLRPSGSRWNAGAYETGSSLPAPPTGLTASVQ